MPIYVYRHCQMEWETFKRVVERSKETCPICGKSTEPVIAPVVAHTFKPFVDDNMTGKPMRIESRAQWKSEMKSRGLRVAERGEKPKDWKTLRDDKISAFKEQCKRKYGSDFFDTDKSRSVVERRKPNV